MSDLDNSLMFDTENAEALKLHLKQQRIALKVIAGDVPYLPRKPESQPPMFRCSHCRSKFSSFSGSCPNCGSADSDLLWMPNQTTRFPAY